MTRSPAGIDLAQLRAEAEQLVADAPEGEALDEVTRALVGYAIRCSVSTLDLHAAEPYAERALDLGATADQLHEVLVLVSGLGVHTLMEGSRSLATLVQRRGQQLPEIDPLRAELKERYLGSTQYWEGFETQVPGFLDALLRLSPAGFEGFMQYGAIPSRTKHLRPLVREILSVAVDATPGHRYMPGLRHHLVNAVVLGAGRRALLETIDLAATAPEPPGVR
jgi:alkylhydroperoxidase/carboxymuconolactone decarboxylase family protein YurZ